MTTRSFHHRALRVTIVLVVATLALPAASILASPTLRDYLYRQASYQLLADRVAGGETDPGRIAERMVDYVAESLYPGGGPVIDTTPWSDLVRGVAWCDQHDMALGTLLAKHGIHARLAFMRDNRMSGPHVMVEVLLDGEWRVFDPYYGLVFRDARRAGFVTLDDLSLDRSIIYDQPRVRALPAGAKRGLAVMFSSMFPIVNPPVRWDSILSTVDRGPLRSGVSSLVRLGLRWLGPTSAHVFQDLYLLLLPDRLASLHEVVDGTTRPRIRSRSEDPALFLYYRARNYHLYGRTAPAERLYREVLLRYPGSPYAEKSLFFSGMLGLQGPGGDPRQAAARLSAFLDKYPQSEWVDLAHYSLGLAWERAGVPERARGQYGLADSDPFLDAAYRLSRLGP